MIHSRNDGQSKGWFVGPWNSSLSIPIGYANQGVNEPHLHAHMHEVYLVARGFSVALVLGKEIRLEAGDLLLIEPGETHTFLSSSPDYFHFVVQTPFVSGDKQVV